MSDIHDAVAERVLIEFSETGADDLFRIVASALRATAQRERERVARVIQYSPGDYGPAMAGVVRAMGEEAAK